MSYSHPAPSTVCCQNLWYACFWGRSACIRKLISEGKKFITKDDDSFPFVDDNYSFYLALHGDLELLQYCVENGCPIGLDTIFGSIKNINIMKWLIEEQGQTVCEYVLSRAYSNKSFECFKYLVKHLKYINTDLFEKTINDLSLEYTFYMLSFAFSNETELDDKIKEKNRMDICMSINRLLTEDAYYFKTNEDRELMMRMIYRFIQNTKFTVPSNLTYLTNALMEISAKKQSTLNVLLQNTQICTDVSKLVCEYI
jgi:hypothetical protein